MIKRTCRGCKALKRSQGLFSCRLNYPFVDITGIPKPTVECPKPKTNVQWCNAVFYKR